MRYDYSKLRGRIVEKCGSNARFAEQIGLSERGLWLKMKGETYFKQSEIQKALEVLDLDGNDINTYFFTQKVQNN